MEQMITTLRQLFAGIWREQNRAWQHNNGPNKPSNEAKDALKEVRTRGAFANQLKEEALLALLPSTERHFADFGRAYLLLPPSEKAAGFVPLMWMGCDLEKTPVDVRIRVTMFCLNGRNLEVFPFRLESGAGRHDFFHAQFGNHDIPPTAPWIPQSQPSFPLCANCPVTLVICLLLTMYGLNETGRILNAHQPHQIEQYKEKLAPWLKV